jgi:hypothetical protein
MTAANSLSLILRHEIEHKLDHVLEELRTPTRPPLSAIRCAAAISQGRIEERN